MPACWSDLSYLFCYYQQKPPGLDVHTKKCMSKAPVF